MTTDRQFMVEQVIDLLCYRIAVLTLIEEMGS
jgi:hypothetical protein